MNPTINGATTSMHRVLIEFMRAQLILAFLVGTGALANAQPVDEQRYAFVVTNQNYSPELNPLRYPHSDGRNVSAALKELGFNVRLLQDGSRAEFEREHAEFISDLKAAGPNAVAFFYFSGHCIPNEALTANFLIFNETVPSARSILQGKDVWNLAADTRPRYLREIYGNIDRIGISLKQVTRAISALNAKASFVVIDSHLDAAEPALLEKTPNRDNGDSPLHGTMFVARGRPGVEAADNNDFSKALAGALLTPGLDALGVFKQVQVQVAEMTNGKQVPWIEDRLLSAYHFQTAASVPANTALMSGNVSSEDRQVAELAFWKAIKESADPQLFKSYLERFPQGEFVDLAKLRIERIAESSRAGRAGAGHRVALVIGNSRYVHSATLANPENDAHAIADALRKLGFADVRAHYNLDKQGIIRALREFGEVAQTADWAVVYYAGHGMEVSGRNYFVPVDAKLDGEGDIEDETVPVSRLFDRLAGAKGIKVVILDACRDNPFVSHLAQRSGKRNLVIGKGLAKLNAESGTLIALAADPGMPAFDGVGNNSPYATALLRHMGERGLDVRLMFGKVYDTMHELMQGKQEPWIQAKLPGRQYSLNPK